MELSLNDLQKLYNASIQGDIEINNLVVPVREITYKPTRYTSTVQTDIRYTSTITNPNILLPLSITNTLFSIDASVRALYNPDPYGFRPVKIQSTATRVRNDMHIYQALLSVIIRKHRFYN